MKLNSEVVRRLKLVRAAKSRAARASLSSGDKVSWTGRHGYTEGTILRIKRKKAICAVENSGNWDVPLNMLTRIA